MSGFSCIHIFYKPVKFQYRKIWGPRWVRSRHKRNNHGIKKNPRHNSVPRWSRNVQAKFSENLIILHTLIIHLKRWYYREKLVGVVVSWGVLNMSWLYTVVCQQNLPPANKIMAPLAFTARQIITQEFQDNNGVRVTFPSLNVSLRL